MDFSSPKGLANHAESVSCYLYDYGRNKNLRADISKSFFKYLLAATWNKMFRRLSSWRSLHFIQQLQLGLNGDIIGEDPDYIASYPQELGPGDRSLAKFFSTNKSYLLTMITKTANVLPETDLPSGFDLTFKAFDNAVAHAINEKTAFYTKESTLDFHYLLYFSFLMAGRALRRIVNDHENLPNKDVILKRPQQYEGKVDIYKSAIIAAELPIRFLLCMLSSTAFAEHMKVWTKGGMSMKPIRPFFEDRASYLEFGLVHGIRLKKPPPDDPTDYFDESPKVGEVIC